MTCEQKWALLLWLALSLALELVAYLALVLLAFYAAAAYLHAYYVYNEVIDVYGPLPWLMVWGYFSIRFASWVTDKMQKAVFNSAKTRILTKEGV